MSKYQISIVYIYYCASRENLIYTSETRNFKKMSLFTITNN